MSLETYTVNQLTTLIRNSQTDSEKLELYPILHSLLMTVPADNSDPELTQIKETIQRRQQEIAQFQSTVQRIYGRIMNYYPFASREYGSFNQHWFTRLNVAKHQHRLRIAQHSRDIRPSNNTDS